MDSVELNKQTSLWPKLCHSLIHHYAILDGCNLIYYDHNMALLLARLQQYRGRKFGEKERLVFTLYDTEYYFQDSRIGFNIYNLVQILIELDISLSHCMLFTNHYGITEHINRFCTSMGLENKMVIAENNYSSPLSQPELPPDPPAYTSDTIDYHFSFLSYIYRDHRGFVRCFIEDNDMTDKTLMAWHPPQFLHHSAYLSRELIDKESPKSVEVDSHLRFMYPTPFTRLNDKVVPDSELRSIFQRGAKCLPEFVQNPLVNSKPNTNNFAAEFLKHSFVNLAAETVFDYPYPYITEKTFKCFSLLRPFVIIGAAGSLAQLRKMGFKTFSDWFDESYDEVEDPVQRLKHLFITMDVISNWSIDHCREVYNNMMETLTYNYNHYANEYCINNYEKDLQELLK